MVKKVNECKYLGIKLDKILTLQSQVKTFLTNMAIAIRTIDSIKKQLPTETLNMLLETLALIHLDYSSLFIQCMSKALVLSL